MARNNINLDLASYINHGILHPAAGNKEIEQGCYEADSYKFPVVCVYPYVVRQAREFLQNRKVELCTVIGFPSGASTSEVKVYEAQEAVENGATELDIMINLGWLKDGKTEEIYQEIAKICEETDQTVKAILETNLLTNTEKRLAAEICMDAGARFLKTNTGWFGGATVADVQFLSEITKGRVGIEASGGIRTIDGAFQLIAAGATRLGTSRGVDLIRQQENFDRDEREMETERRRERERQQDTYSSDDEDL